MNGKKKLISKITALLLALLLTNHFVFQAYASGETEVVVTESVADGVSSEVDNIAEAETIADESVAMEAEPLLRFDGDDDGGDEPDQASVAGQYHRQYPSGYEPLRHVPFLLGEGTDLRYVRTVLHPEDIRTDR